MEMSSKSLLSRRRRRAFTRYRLTPETIGMSPFSFDYTPRNAGNRLFLRRKRPGMIRALLFYWLGYLDSNQGITVSETAVLPLDYTPIASKKYRAWGGVCQQEIVLFVVCFPMLYLASPVDLFEGQQECHVVGKSERAEGEGEVASFPKSVGKPVAASEEENKVSFPGHRLRKPGGELRRRDFLGMDIQKEQILLILDPEKGSLPFLGKGTADLFLGGLRRKPLLRKVFDLDLPELGKPLAVFPDAGNKEILLRLSRNKETEVHLLPPFVSSLSLAILRIPSGR